MGNWLPAIGIVLLFLIPREANSQQLYSKKVEMRNAVGYSVQSPDSVFIFRSQESFSALVIKSQYQGKYYLYLDDDLTPIPRDEDIDEPTYFISLPTPRQVVRLVVPKDISFDLFSIQSGESPDTRSRTAKEELTLDCTDPIEFVPQSTWREGLPVPDYTRSFHQVFHNIVHHSAGSNTNTNYAQVVRDIYIFHTQINGWSDIGYNYLIGQDGTIFAGRDPGTGSQDMVRGAHFCGANSGTLGICLLGNFETATPTSEAWASLESLLTFQLINQGLDPFDSFSHPLGTLGSITGHREGCATLCPGENVFSQLQQLRFSLASMIEECQPMEPTLSFEADTLVGVKETVVYENTSKGYDTYRWILEGAFPQWVESQNAQSTYSTPGRYDVMLIGEKGTTSDTLVMSDFIQVSLLENEPVVFPNPATSQSILNVDFKERIERIELVSLNGKLVQQWEKVTQYINLPQTRAGIYFLNVIANDTKYTSKLVLN